MIFKIVIISVCWLVGPMRVLHIIFFFGPSATIFCILFFIHRPRALMCRALRLFRKNVVIAGIERRGKSVHVYIYDLCAELHEKTCKIKELYCCALDGHIFMILCRVFGFSGRNGHARGDLNCILWTADLTLRDHHS